MRIAKATRCNPAKVSGKPSSSRTRRRKRVVYATSRSTTQRFGSSTTPCVASGSFTTAKVIPCSSAVSALSAPVSP